MDGPYPRPTSAAVSAVMRGNRKADTKPELALRSALHRAGLRYRVRQRLRGGAVAVVPDVVFTRSKVAVFVDGCWWHRCAIHANTPRVNTGYWLPKLARNVERDRRVDGALSEAGWRVIRIWEHDVTADIDACVRRVADAVHRADPGGPTTVSEPPVSAAGLDRRRWDARQ